MDQSILIQISPESLQNMISTAVEKGIENGLKSRNPNEMLTREEVSKECRVSLVTVHNWINKGVLLAEKIEGRILISRESLEKAIKERRVLKKVKR